MQVMRILHSSVRQVPRMTIQTQLVLRYGLTIRPHGMRARMALTAALRRHAISQDLSMRLAESAWYEQGFPKREGHAEQQATASQNRQVQGK